jgi:glycyl-tRNA synthetase
MSILEEISSLAKRRGFVYPGSDIYGGLAGTWDYGPLGVELKNNIKQEFWRSVVQGREDVVGVDAAILMNPKVWEASGHVESFTDPLVECKKCHKRFRADNVADPKNPMAVAKICPECGGKLTDPKQFNLMVDAHLGAIEGEKERVYLRGEITQGVHVNFRQVLDSTRVKIPFGVAQVGKAFRNEITPGQFTFRSREFEQMELQYYIKPTDADSREWFRHWKGARMDWYVGLGMSQEHLRFYEHAPSERAHYAREAFDIEYQLEDEWKEMEGIHHRGDWDLTRHQQFSGEDMMYVDPDTKEKFVPWVIETSGGVDRAALFFLVDAYVEEKVKDPASAKASSGGETRTVLKLHPKLAPYKAAVFPLLANKPKLVALARKVYDELKGELMVAWDERGNIGKRYRTQDEVGTPYCVTVDFDSLEKKDVTVRDRDSMKQTRVKIAKLGEWLGKKLQ